MNNLMKKLSSHNSGKSRIKNSVLSIVILVEIFALCVVGTFAWVETVSSIKITNEANTVGTIKNDTKYTDMMIGGESGTIDLLDYFEPSGDMHFAPASSADGKTFYFPKANISSNFIYRKGNVSDKNTTYLSASFRLKADTNADFFFWKDATHDINVSDDIRVSVTAYTEGDNPEGTYDPVSGRLISNTKIYANNASTTAVVNSTSGATGSTAVEKFIDHQKGKSSTARLFAVGANETKIVTINVWLQKKTSGNTDITSNMSVSQAINNLGITSSLTPRHVTLLPTPTWDTGAQTYYAWCWTPNSNQKSRLYKLELNSEEEHYTFDYNGTYTKTTFVRAVPGCTVQPGEYDSWPFTLSTNSNDQNNNKYWNQTVDTSIPNDPVDPTYIIETISGGTDSKSTGSWHDPATVKVAYVTGQDSDCGTLTATSYIGSATSSHVIESTNSNSQKHKDTVHAWPGKLVSLTASAKTNYAFVGWYTDAAGTTPAPTVNSTAYTATNYKPNAPSTASEITYYAKFVETRKLTIYRYLDGSNVSTACGTITIAGTDSTSGTTATKTVNKGTSVSFSATAAKGYTLDGIYTTATGTNTASSPVTLNSNTSYYARFRTNTHAVKLYTIGSTGSTVQYGNETAATSVEKTGVKYNSSVTIKANPASGYKFVGWYTNSSGTGTATSTNASYTFTMGDADVTYYAKFEAKNQYYLKASWNSWSESQAHLTGTVDELTYTQELDPGEYTFKIYDGAESLHWSNAYEYKYKKSSSTDTYLGASGGDTLNSSTSTGNMQLNVGYAGSFVFHFNRSTNKFWITATDVTTYHVAGSDLTGSWDATNANKMTKVSTYEYTYSVYVNGNDKEFKIRTNSGTYYGNGYGYHNGYYGASGGDTLSTSGSNMKMSGNKTYVFHFNSNTKKFWITDS